MSNQPPSEAAPAESASNGAVVPPAPTETPAAPVLSNAELKKRAKAEKAAKRAREKGENQGGGAPSAGPSQGAVKKPEGKSKETKAGQQGAQGAGKAQQESSQQRPLALRRRPSQNGPPAIAQVKESKSSEKKRTTDSQVGLFGHLYGQPRRHKIAGAPKEVHPAILALGLQMSSYVVCGSNARCVAMLLAFKSVIDSYTTPPGIALSRHLTSHHLSPQISYLSSCRPLSVAQGNAIRWLKDLIIKIDPSVPEMTAKAHLCSSIDNFIQERITMADEVIASTAHTKIVDGDVVLTFAKSSIVLKTLLRAHKVGTRFRVVVVDSKPLFEGKHLAKALAHEGIHVTYYQIGAAAHAVKSATKVLLGAHAMMSNGRLYSRVGTAIVAMLAHERDLPVIVCAESVKFTERVALDSIVTNEVAPADEILGEGEWIGDDADEEAENGAPKGRDAKLVKWKETKGLQLLNILYDVTPSDYITMVVTENGSLPPSSVPVVHRLSTNI